MRIPISLTTSKKAWPFKHNNGPSSQTIGPGEWDVKDVIPEKVMSLVLTLFQLCASFTTKSLIDLSTTTHLTWCHIKTQIEDITTDGLEEFSRLHHQSEVTILTHIKAEINSVNNIGEKMPSSLNSTMVFTWTTCKLYPEKPGNSGAGKLPNAADGHNGDISTINTQEELGLGSTLSPMQTVDPFEEDIIILPMIRIIYHLYVLIQL